MKLVWVTISDKGGPEERLHFRATVRANLSYYAVFDTSAVDDQLGVNRVPGQIFPGQHTCFWFPQQMVNPGDNIVLYTRAGHVSSETRGAAVFHFFFRGLNAPLYTSRTSCPVLYELNTWEGRVW